MLELSLLLQQWYVLSMLQAHIGYYITCKRDWDKWLRIEYITTLWMGPIEFMWYSKILPGHCDTNAIQNVCFACNGLLHNSLCLLPIILSLSYKYMYIRLITKIILCSCPRDKGYNWLVVTFSETSILLLLDKQKTKVWLWLYGQ